MHSRARVHADQARGAPQLSFSFLLDTAPACAHMSKATRGARLPSVETAPASKGSPRHANGGKRTVQGAVEEVVHHAAVAKAYLVLGRMDVDVHVAGGQINTQDYSWISTLWDKSLISFTYCPTQSCVFDIAIVYIEIGIVLTSSPVYPNG